MRMILMLATLAGCSAYHKAPESAGEVSMSGGPANIGVHYMGAETAQKAIEEGGMTTYTTTTRGGTTSITHTDLAGLYPYGYGAAGVPVLTPDQVASQQLTLLRRQQELGLGQPLPTLPARGTTPAQPGTAPSGSTAKVPCPKDRMPVNEAERLSCVEERTKALETVHSTP